VPKASVACVLKMVPGAHGKFFIKLQFKIFTAITLAIENFFGTIESGFFIFHSIPHENFWADPDGKFRPNLYEFLRKIFDALWGFRPPPRGHPPVAIMPYYPDTIR
jgi:hypothetical protein